MATTETVWVEGENVHASSSVSNGSSAEDSISLVATDKEFIIVNVQFSCNPAASATGDCTCEIFAAPDGTNYDTEALLSTVISFVAKSAVKRATICLPPMSRFKAKMTNNSGQSVTYIGEYSGLKLVTA
jgi:hypothetical protein